MVDPRRVAAVASGRFVARLVLISLVPVFLGGALLLIEFWLASNTAVPETTTTFLQVLALIVVIVTGIAAMVYFGRAVAGPLSTAIEWVENLRRGDLEPPRRADGRIEGQDEHGQWRGGWRTFHDFFDALDHLTDQLRAAERERDQARTARAEWIAGISHDLKTPLTSVRGYAMLLESGEEPPSEVSRQARAILEQTDAMQRLVDDLEMTLRVRAGAVPTEMRTLDATELAREAAVMVANDPRARGRDVSFSDTGESLWVVADTKMVTRALVNIIVNAVVHNPEGTSIEVSAARHGGRIGILVSDDGVGMDEEMRTHLFERYFRGEVPGREVSGTGLGMAVADHLVRAQGGTIEVQSEVGVGTRVCIYLPAAPGDAAERLPGSPEG